VRTEPKPDKSIGLRLDYFVASEALVQKEHGTVPRVIDSQILSDFVALDHAAISLTLAVS
jgi:exonuclease III